MTKDDRPNVRRGSYWSPDDQPDIKTDSHWSTEVEWISEPEGWEQKLPGKE